MTALAAGRNTPRIDGRAFQGPVAATTTCYEGGIACRDASGNLVPGSTALGLTAVGVFSSRAANAGGAGAINADYTAGVFGFENSGSTDAITDDDIGEIAWIVDDQTVAKRQAGTRSAAGRIVAVDSNYVWVEVGALPAATGRLPVTIGSLSNKATDAAVLRWVAPMAGTIAKSFTVLNAALATGDATLTLAINGTAVTGGVLTVTQSGSAAGDVDSASPTAAATFAAGDVITVTGGGASTATSTSTVVLLITPHA
jgi:hypothetical protein